MIKIECPSSGNNANSCSWQPLEGSVRDRPDVGIVKCVSCALVTHAGDLSKNVDYENGSMHEWAKGYGGTLPLLEFDSERRVTQIKTLHSSHPHESLLDFGCGNGEMLKAFSGTYDVLGIEPDKYAREIAISKDLTVYDSPDLLISENTKVDIVTLFHVVEHFYLPGTQLNSIKHILKPGGLLVIETPNSGDALLTQYENSSFQNFTYWSHHPMLHSHYSLSLLLERCGFKIIENSGVQRYSLSNHLYWLSKGLPGGHEFFNTFISKQTNESYANDLIRNKMCDTIWTVAEFIK